MLGKTEVKVVRPRGDGRHCDLCGCSFPAVRCDKCGSQIFCLSCDDMYHRHPKRRFHLRKAVDPTPTPQARPVLPMKVSQLASSPGDPAKMPLPPPRKKKPGKSFFDSFRRGSPSSDNSPPIPKKEYSWTDRLGSIKKFMSNRPLPPLPKDEDIQQPQEQQRSSPPRKNDMSFIHKKVDEKPPQLPHRAQAKSPHRKLSHEDFALLPQESQVPANNAEWSPNFGAPTNNFRQPTTVPQTEHLNGQANRDSSEREISAGRFRSRSLQDTPSPQGGMPSFREQPNLSPTMPPDVRGYSTLKRPSAQAQDILNQSFMSTPGDHFAGMHTSSSVTDLHTLDSPTARGLHQFPNFPMPPHYPHPHPYPMYPHYPNYPQYFGTSFANLSTALPSTDGDFSDHSDASGFSGKKHHKHSAFGIKAKRSQSVMYDRMAYPPQYYPFGGFPPHPPLPGYGAAPWGQTDHPVEAPPSPATSVRSFGRSHRSRHRKKKIIASDHNDEDDERLSVRSSPRSRTTSSSDRLRKRKPPKKFERSASPSSLTSSEEEKENHATEDRLSPQMQTEFSQGDGYQTKQNKKKINKDATKLEQKTKQYGSKTKPTSHQKLKTDDKNFSPKFKKKEKLTLSSSEPMDVNEEKVEPLQKTAVTQQEDTEMKDESDYQSEEGEEEIQIHEEKRESPLPESQWQCEHCTFINSTEHRICQVCCKTKPGCVPQPDPNLLGLPEIQASSSAAASPDIPALNTTSESLTSDTAKEYLTPPAAAEDDSPSAHSENEGQNFAKLNSDLEEAEKELSRGLMELMKLKEESEIASTGAANRRLSVDTPTVKEDRKTPNIHPEPNLGVTETETILPQLSDKTPASTEQMNHQSNVHEAVSVTSKSVGTDSMNFDFLQQTQVKENINPPTVKPITFNSYIQDQLPPSNSFSETATPAASSQKDITGKPAPRKDSSCQTYQDDNGPQMMENEIPFPHTDNMDFQYPYNRVDSMKSPHLPPIAAPGYRGFSGRNQPLMHRSHSRSSLFGDRYGDARAVHPEFDNLGFGFGPSPMYRSLSRSSLTGDYSDPWMSDVRSLRRPDFYLSMEELVERRRLESKRAQGLELVRMIRDAEQQGFTADDIHVALNNCGKQNPVDWLQTNWRGMVDTVVTLATNYGKDKHENDIGVLSENEARDALRMHKGNIWAAVTECVEGRQRKFLELKARGNFSTKEIVDALTQSEGNVELAYTRMSTATLKPFLMRIWGTGEGVENQDGAVCDPAEFLHQGPSGWPKDSTLRAENAPYGDIERCSDQEDWDDDDDVEEEVSWNEDEEDEMVGPENFDVEPPVDNRDKRAFPGNHITTPESDSEYCDAFDPVGEARNATSSSPVDELFCVSPNSGLESPKNKKKGTSFLSRLAALRKTKKPEVEDNAEKDDINKGQLLNHEANSSDSKNDRAKNEQAEETKIRPSDSNATEINKIYSPLNILKQTFSAIKDSVIGSNNKNESKHPRSITEARTIIVHDTAAQEVLLSEENANKQERSVELLAANEYKNENTEKIIFEPNYKETEPVPVPFAENLKDNTANRILSTSSPINTDPTLSEKIPRKQHKSESIAPEVKSIAPEVKNIAQNKFELVASEKVSEESSPDTLTNIQSPENVEDERVDVGKSLPTGTLKKFQDNNISADLKTDIKNQSSKKSEEEKFLTQQKSPVIGNKLLEVENNAKAGVSQSSVPTTSTEFSSDAVATAGTAKNDLKENSALRNVAKGRNNKNESESSDVKETGKFPDIVSVKTGDVKLKIKKQKEGLKLKIPSPEKTNSEILTNQHKTDEQKETLVAADNNLDIDIKLDEKQKDLTKEADNIVIAASENYSLPLDESSMSQTLQGYQNSDSNSLTTNKIEKTQESNEESKNNISQNEFHDMASKIAEKMENCLEVLKSTENIFFEESEENIPSSSKEEERTSERNETTENRANSSHQTSESLKEKDDKVATDTPEITVREKEEKDDKFATGTPEISFREKEEKLSTDAHSLLASLNQTEKLPTDRANQATEIIKENTTSPGKYSSSDTIKQHATFDVTALEQPSSSNEASVDGNKSVTSKISQKTSAEDNDFTKSKSPVSEITSTTPNTPYSEDSVEVPVIFPGVKAKTFTGAVNKKAKLQLAGNDKNLNFPSTNSSTPETITDVTQSDRVLIDKKEDTSEKQTPTTNSVILRKEHAKQLYQSATEPHVNSIDISNGEKISSAIESHQHSQNIFNENKIEKQFPVQAEHKSDEPVSSQETQIIKETEKNLPESPVTAGTEKSNWKLQVEDVKSKAEKNILATANTQAPTTTSNKISDRLAKFQGNKITSVAANSRFSSGAATSSSKVLDSHKKEKEKKNDAAASNNKTPVFTSSKISDSQPQVQEETNDIAGTNGDARVSTSNKVSDSQTDVQDKIKDLAEANSESQVSTSSKFSNSREKEHDNENDVPVSNTTVQVSTSSRISGIQPKEQDEKNELVMTNNEEEASSSSTESDSKEKMQETKNISIQADSEASISTTSNETSKEIEGATGTLPVQEDDVPLSPTSSGDKRPASRVETLKHSFRDATEGSSQSRSQSPLRPQSPFGRMTSLSARKEAIAQERNKEISKTTPPTVEKKPWFIEKVQTPKPSLPKRSIKQQLEFERKIRKLVSERKCRTYRKAEIVVQLLELNFAEQEALQAAHECSTLDQAISYLQQECLLCTGMYPVGQIVSMIHCPHKACRECIKAYFTIQIRDRTIMELLCPFCNEPDISDEDVAQDYFNHLDILLKKLVEPEIHELFQRKLRDRVLMKDPNFRWCSQCSSGFIAMPNLKRLICPDCNAITCAKCRRPWEREHEGISCEAFATWKDANDPEAQTAGLAKLLQEDGIDCPNCHFRYTLAKGGCMHFRCIQCQHDFCSGCSKPFKMGQKCGVSEYCVKLGLHAHHPRNCLFYLRDKEPEDLQRLLELNDVEYNKDPPEGMELKSVCQVMEQKETSDGLVDDICGKEVLECQAGLCRVHYVEYLGQLVNKHKIDPIQIFCNDDLELVLRRASKRLPAKSYRDSEVKYREKLVQLIQEELPLELSEGS